MVDVIEETNWLEAEEKGLMKDFSGERLPSLQIEEGKITTITIDFSKAFEKWIDKETGKVKAIVPVLHNAEKKNLWVNLKNPLYGQIIRAGRLGQKVFKITRSGKQEQTRYTILQE